MRASRSERGVPPCASLLTVSMAIRESEVIASMEWSSLSRAKAIACLSSSGTEHSGPRYPPWVGVGLFLASIENTPLAVCPSAPVKSM